MEGETKWPPDGIFKRIFVNENAGISINISLNFVAYSVPGHFWTNDGLVHWRIYTSLGLHELIK